MNSTYRVEDVWGVEVQLCAFLTLPLDGGEWSASLLLYIRKSKPVRNNWEVGWAAHCFWV